MVRPWLFNVAVSSWLLFGFLTASVAAEPETTRVDFFEKRIRPVLVEQCYQCHSAKSKAVKGGLQLDTRAGFRRGGDSGRVIVPGKVQESLLIEALRYESLEMPPKGKLPDEVIADFAKWVQMGAPDPRAGGVVRKAVGIDIKQGREFWSFRPLRKPRLPVVQNQDWPRGKIDQYVLEKWEAKGIRCVGDAEKRTLIRRAYFDLIGLPPTPQAVKEFLSDSSIDAFEKVIDSLLGNVHFGERWGRHWLDVVRFAESSGGGRTRIFQDAWRYRDYIIDAFNRDKPFHQFIAEQLAGDLLPSANDQQRKDNLVATGFLALGPTNYELQDKQLLRMEVVDEQLDTIGRAFLGMTIGCARCHDHKFDPIPTSDYYALAGILRSTKTLIHANVSDFVEAELPVSVEHRRALAEHERKLKPIEESVNKVKANLKQLRDRFAGKRITSDPNQLPGIVLDDTQAKFSGKWSNSKNNLYFVGDGYKFASDGKSAAVYQFPIRTPGEYEVRTSYNAHPNRSGKVFVTITHAAGSTTKRVSHKQQPPIDELFVSLGRYRFERGQAAEVAVSCKGADGVVVVDAVQLIPVKLLAQRRPEPTTDEKERQELQSQIGQVEQKLKGFEAELRKLTNQAPTPAPKTMSVRDEDDDEIGDCHICIRGDVHTLGDKVPRGFLQVASNTSTEELREEQSGRVELARWIGSNDNPLTSRVIANRLWHHLFGVGLVRTVDNFGNMGESPSHPQLLDYLASSFIDSGWSIKKTIKAIMLSRAYQISSQSVPENAKIDPENRLFWKRNRRRLDAEAIRDGILFVSGHLDLTVGGPTIDPAATSEFNYKFVTCRRSIYVPVFRNALHDIFEVFDFADPNLVVGRRSTSTLPTQALFLMNSSFVLEQSRHAAVRLLDGPEIDDAQRIDMAYLRTLGRSPTGTERTLALRYVSRYNASVAGQASRSQTDAWSRLYQVLYSCIDFRFVD